MLGVGAALPWLARCGREGPRAPGALTVLVNAEAERLDPRFPSDALGSTLSRLVFAGLLESDPETFEPRLALAESVSAVDERTVRAVLRPDARFHDGAPVRARDVAATFRAILDPARGSLLRGTYARVFAGANALDERTVEFALTGPDGTYPSLLQQPVLRERDALGGELTAVAGNEARFVGAGPMRPVGFERGDFRFECVAPRAGQARSLRFLTMHDPNTLALRLLHGDADVAEAKPELFDVFDHRPGFRLASARSAGFTYVGLRNDHPLLARPEARRAIACALDRGALLAGKLGRFGVPATGPLPPSHWAYEGAVAREPYDPARARALLAAARASLPPDAPPLVLRCTNVRFALTTARAIAAMLAAVGLDVEVRPSELATLLADLRGGRYDLTLMTMPDLSDPWGLAVLFSSAARTTPENPRAGLNRWRYSNPDLDRVLEQGRTAAGPDARRPFYAEAQRILARDLPVVPLWHADVVYAAGPRVRSLRPRGDSQLDFLLALELAG